MKWDLHYHFNWRFCGYVWDQSITMRSPIDCISYATKCWATIVIVLCTKQRKFRSETFVVPSLSASVGDFASSYVVSSASVGTIFSKWVKWCLDRLSTCILTTLQTMVNCLRQSGLFMPSQGYWIKKVVQKL